MQKLLKKIALELSEDSKVKAVYLFGSQATGKAGPLSDIDICVIAPGLSEQEKSNIWSYASEKVEVVLFDDIPLTIKNRVFREGKPLYVANQKYIDDLNWRTTKEYWDFKPILKEFIEEYIPGAEYV